MDAQTFLERLDKVRQTGANKWIARCPAHDDGRPSLSIREASDGKILLTCFAGCSASEIVSALGLKLSDLFSDDSEKPRRTHANSEAVAHERLVLELARADMNRGKELNATDTRRVELALNRLEAAA